MVVVGKKETKNTPASKQHMVLTMTKLEQQPAGVFSTFSIFNPNSTHESPRIQKRNRRVFVCIPCHRRKLKCDKGQPCSRCTQSGSIQDCVYQPSPNGAKQRASQSISPEPKLSPSRRESPSIPDSVPSWYRLDDGRTRVSGTTHWAKIASEFEEARPYVFGTEPLWDARYRQIKGLKYLFSSFSSSNFPFSHAPAIPPSQRIVINQLPPRHVVDALVSCYFQTCEVTHRLFHPLQFWDELQVFWGGGELVQDAWLAQLFMVLALGCQNVPDYILHNTGKSQGQWTEAFLEGAQISFGRSPYMAAPSLTTVRTLCLMVLAEMLELVKGTSSTQIVSLMGFLSRLTITMQLHRTTTLFPTMPIFEAEMRRRVWVTIQLLDVDVAMRAGTSFLCREHDSEPPINMNEADFHPEQGIWAPEAVWASPQGYTDGTFQVKLSEFLPLVAEIIDTVNSPTQPLLDYSVVLSWEKTLRRNMKNIESAFSSQSHSRPDLCREALMQRQLIDVLAHRAKLAMHHAFARSPYDARFEPSYKAVPESSLALLGIQETWTMLNSADSIGSGSRSPSPSSSSADEASNLTGWLADLCHDDFDAAMLHLILMIRRDSFGSRASDDILPNNMAWVVLQRSLILLRQRACRSLQHFKEFVGLSIMASCLQCLRSPEAMLSTMMQVAGDIEQMVLSGKQDMIWIENELDLLVQEDTDASTLLNVDPELLDLHI